METILSKFKHHGLTASYYFADDTASGEWRNGYGEQRKALELFDAHPDLHAEMREIAKNFLWSLSSERPSTEE